jgi:ATP-binding cassette, subfamily B, bacterial PglK
MGGCQPTYMGIYRAVDHPMRQLQVKNEFLGLFPRYLLEAVGMVMIALLGALLVMQRGSATMVIPLLGGLALGAQRLLPPLQQIYFCWSQLNRRNGDLAGLLSMLEQAVPVEFHAMQPWKLKYSIRLEEVSFGYGVDRPQVLHGLNMEIKRGTRIGIIGSTGSGKSTLVDIMMGLLIPSTGKLLVDGLDIHDRTHPDWLPTWQLAIAHVPQNIYLADCPIAENIAFGIPKKDIDMQRLRVAAEQAQIANFIESSPDGYSTFVGERGIRLSGGQRQRIGIARALYKQAQILVFDEATSALDGATEQALIHSIDELSAQLTIVMIAHRFSTLECCDRIVQLKDNTISENY